MWQDFARSRDASSIHSTSAAWRFDRTVHDSAGYRVQQAHIQLQSNLVRTNFKGLNTFVCLIGSSSYPGLTKNRYAYQMDCIYVKVHAVVHVFDISEDCIIVPQGA